MSAHLRREIEQLKKSILSLGGVVEERVWESVRSVVQRDGELARKVIEGDPQIDQREVEVEEDCLKLLALYQPVAIDLRFIVAILKINSDLERIGDLAVNIAERSLELAGRENYGMPFDLSGMAEKSRSMVRRSLDALVNLDPCLAKAVCAEDEEVDAMKRRTFERVRELIGEEPGRTDFLLQLLLVSRHLERIGDHATNIAEDVIYMAEGKIVRHRIEEFGSASA
jgi:phosphate transport system protein